MTIDFEAFASSEKEDPYPVYAELRENDPVHFEKGRIVPFWIVTRWEDCVSVLRDPRFTATKFPPALIQGLLDGPDPGLAAIARTVTNIMLMKDPPEHTRLRGLVNKAFTPRRIEGLRARIETLVDELLDDVEAKGSLELISDFAAPLPIIVIAELLGVPAEDRGSFKHWSDDFARFIDGSIREQGLPEAAKAAHALSDYFRDFIAELRKSPRDDLMSALIEAHEADDALSLDELVSNAILLLGAGHETTTNLLANGTLALLRHRGELERLRAEPALARSAVEELLRFDSPVQMTARLPGEDLEIRGQQIPAGQEVNLILAAANRDPAQFEDPDRLDLTGEKLRWKPGMVLRGLKALPLAF